MRNGKSIRENVLEFIDQQDTKPASKKCDLFVLLKFLTYLVQQKIDPEKVKRSHVIAYKRSLIDQNKSALTIDKYLGLVRRFYGYLEDMGVYENIAADIHSIKRYKGYRKKYLERDDVIKLLNSIDRSTLVGLRDYAMINLMVRCGLRRCEVNRLNVCDLHGDYLNIIRKGHYEKEKIGINDAVFEPIHTYLLRLGNFNDDSPLFASLSRNTHRARLTETAISILVKSRIEKIVSDPDISCHSLRHSFAVNSIRAGATIFEVQNALGHESAETTKIYLSMIEKETKQNNPALHIVSDYFDKTP
jgi:site-specific recombinase XerD